MPLYSLKDNTKITDEGFLGSRLRDQLCDRTLETLSKEQGVFIFPPLADDSSELDKDQSVVSHWHGDIWTGNLMGFLGLGDERLSIASRFSESQDNGNDYFLHHMLQKVLGFSGIDFKLDLDSDESLYRILELLFPGYLTRALSRGVYKTYVRREFDDAHVRGTIDIPRFIRDDLPFTGKVSYKTRELSTDNQVTELVRHTIATIIGGSSPVSYLMRRNREARDAVVAIRNATPGYRRQDRTRVIAHNRKHPVRSGYFRPYRDLQRLCIALLRGERVSVLGNSPDKVHGILFDGAWLWEEYLNKLFEESGIGAVHPRNRKGQGAQHFFKGGVGLIYPDYLLSSGDSTYVLDAKYKPIDNIYGRDYQQMLSYMFRFEAKTGALIYPRGSEDGGNRELLLLSGIENPRPRIGADTVRVLKWGLRIPTGCSSQDEFADRMSKEEEDFLEKLQAARPEVEPSDAALV